MINSTTTPSATVERAAVFDHNGGCVTLEAVAPAPDHAALIDTLEEELLESLQHGGKVNIKDVTTALVARAKKEILGQLLVRLLCVLADSRNVKLDIEVLISAAGLPIRDEPDLQVARRHGVSRQTFSARKKALLEVLGLTPPPHSKSLKACESYKLNNRRNAKLN